MFGALFLKDCRQVIKSATYIIFIFVLLLFGYSQIGSDFDKIEKPVKGLDNYGVKYVQNPEIIMPNAVKSLYNEFVNNSYISYPIGFYRNVKLDYAKQERMAGAISELTGIPTDKLKASINMEKAAIQINKDTVVKDGKGNYKVAIPDNGSLQTQSELDVAVAKSVTYDGFLSLMAKADKIIGGGSKYSEVFLKRFGEVPRTYQDALKVYDDIVGKDRITGALARVFCDYFGIMLAILPVFIAVAAGMRDRRARILELIHYRKASSFAIVLSRFFAMIIMTYLPVLLLAVYATIKTVGNYTGFDVDIFAFIKYSFIWLVPTIMVSTAVGMFLTELTETPIAIIVQGLWWFIGLFSGMERIDGGYGTGLILRHNEIGNTQVYLNSLDTLLLNRFVYTLFALLLVFFTVIIYGQKRRGRLNNYGKFKKVSFHSIGKLKA